MRLLGGGFSGLPTKPAPMPEEKSYSKPQEQELADEGSTTLKSVRLDSVGS
jgi:hypothetical protein